MADFIKCDYKKDICAKSVSLDKYSHLCRHCIHKYLSHIVDCAADIEQINKLHLRRLCPQDIMRAHKRLLPNLNHNSDYVIPHVLTGDIKCDFDEFMKLLSGMKWTCKLEFSQVRDYISNTYGTEYLADLSEQNIYNEKDPEYIFEHVSYILANYPDEQTKYT